MITAGSLDDPSLYKPTLDIFTSSAQPWDHMNPVLINVIRILVPLVISDEDLSQGLEILERVLGDAGA